VPNPQGEAIFIKFALALSLIMWSPVYTSLCFFLGPRCTSECKNVGGQESKCVSKIINGLSEQSTYTVQYSLRT
jgi:hypothetical protein